MKRFAALALPFCFAQPLACTAPPPSNESPPPSAASALSSSKTPPSATSSTPPPSLSAPPQNPPQELGSGELILHGQKLKLKSALLYSHGGKEKRITLSTAPLNCEHVQAQSRMLLPEEKTVRLGIAPPVPGTPGKSIVSLVYPMAATGMPASTSILSNSLTPLPEPKDAALKISLNFEYNEPPNTFRNEPAQSLHLKGDFVFKYCGVFPSSPTATPNPQPKLQVSVGGESIAMQGALLIPYEDRFRLLLSSGAGSCKRDSFSDLQFEIGLRPGDSAIKGIVLTGTRIRGTSQGDPSKIRVKTPKKLPAPGKMQELSIKGSASLPTQGDAGTIVQIPVKLSGDLSALVCEN